MSNALSEVQEVGVTDDDVQIFSTAIRMHGFLKAKLPELSKDEIHGCIYKLIQAGIEEVDSVEVHLARSLQEAPFKGWSLFCATERVGTFYSVSTFVGKIDPTHPSPEELWQISIFPLKVPTTNEFS